LLRALHRDPHQSSYISDVAYGIKYVRSNPYTGHIRVRLLWYWDVGVCKRFVYSAKWNPA